MTTISIGDFQVTAVLDGIDRSGPSLMGYDAVAAISICAHAGVPFVEGFLPMAIHAFVIHGPGVLVVIDTGSADDFSPGHAGFFGRAFAKAGFNPDEVTHVIITHLHVDHVGFLRDPGGAAFFPNAELVISAQEWAFAHDAAIYEAGPDMLRETIDRGRRVVAPYADRTRRIDGAGAVVPGLRLVAMPGHTAGHSGVMVGDKLLIICDVLHQPVLQAARPDWSCVFDAEKGVARATRRAVLTQAADDDLLVAGMHLDPPGFATIRRAGDAFAIHPFPAAD